MKEWGKIPQQSFLVVATTKDSGTITLLFRARLVRIAFFLQMKNHNFQNCILCFPGYVCPI